ncbi:hypothetical protein BVG18_10950 [Acinetobacter lwoffii]|uniref:hypothetical protein n=1 Tax=Acinetobacter lwoffii TaxID=28090 RepID=UPI000A323960|nr:hypothetical protein BVG18_10950 [Acinetobacter lwoffii]
MDLQKEREAFEAVTNIYHCIYNADLNYYFSGSKFVGDKAEMEVNAGWKAWQAAIARMEVRINTLDEMLLNQGEALAQAKAQAVPEGFVLVKTSDRDQEMLELIDQRDHMEGQAEELKDKLQALYGVDFGEHSSCNFPFQNAIDYDDSDFVLVKKNHLSEVVEKIERMFEEDSLLALGELLPIQQGIKAMIEAQEPTND